MANLVNAVIMRIVLCALIFCLSSLSVLAAHNMPVSVARVVFFADGAFEIELQFDVDSSTGTLLPEDLELFDLIIAYAKSRLHGDGEKEMRQLAQLICDGVQLDFSGVLVRPELVRLDFGVPDDIKRLQRALFRGRIPAAHTRCRWVAHAMLPYVNLQMSRQGDTGLAEGMLIEVVPLNTASAEWTGVPSRSLDVVGVYWWQGIVHIIPQGFDHILFIVGLFFACSNRSSLLWQVSAFTLAHSITLGMCASGMSLPLWMQGLVEPIIALSIIAVAVENCFFCEMRSWRPYVVFLFGLIHGMGFAGVLGDVGLPDDFFWVALLSFNMGIEMTQLFILGCMALLLYAFMKKQWYHCALVIPIGIAVALAGSFMLYARIFA